MSSNSGGGRPRSTSFSRIENPSKSVRDEIMEEEGATEMSALGRSKVTPTLTRRGSFVMESEDGTLDILHSTRTSKQLSQMETPKPGTSRRMLEKMEREPSYTAPQYPGTTAGHIAHIKRFTWTPEHGFQEVADDTHYSGKAKGDFGPGTMSALRALQWPNLQTPEDSHHSEAEYSAKQYGPKVAEPIQPPRSGFLVHQMDGVNDMCTTCRSGISKNFKGTEGHVTTYTSSDPFGTTGDWNKHDGDVMEGPGSIFRNRPETMLKAPSKSSHVERAQEMRKLRGTARSRSSSESESSSSSSSSSSLASPRLERRAQPKKAQPKKELPEAPSRKRGRERTTSESSSSSEDNSAGFTPPVLAKPKPAPLFRSLDKPRSSRSGGRKPPMALPQPEASASQPKPPAKRTKSVDNMTPSAQWTRGKDGRLKR